MKHLWIAGVALLVLAVGVLRPSMVEPFGWEYPTKCFSCERQMGKDLGWMGQPTKCFSCEKDLIQRTGRIDAAYEAHPGKVYGPTFL